MTPPTNPAECHPGLPPDQAAWLPVAAQVLAGKYDRSDSSTRQSLIIGLRSIDHPACRQALQYLTTTDATQAPKRSNPRTKAVDRELDALRAHR